MHGHKGGGRGKVRNNCGGRRENTRGIRRRGGGPGREFGRLSGQNLKLALRKRLETMRVQ